MSDRVVFRGYGNTKLCEDGCNAQVRRDARVPYVGGERHDSIVSSIRSLNPTESMAIMLMMTKGPSARRGCRTGGRGSETRQLAADSTTIWTEQSESRVRGRVALERVFRAESTTVTTPFSASHDVSYTFLARDNNSYRLPGVDRLKPNPN